MKRKKRVLSSRIQKWKAAYMREQREARKAAKICNSINDNVSNSDDEKRELILKTVKRKRDANPSNNDSGSDSASELYEDKNKTTSAHGFKLPRETLGKRQKKHQISDMTELLKKENWPLEPFTEIREAKRGSWVRWAKRFKAVCSLIPGLTANQARTMLLLKGGGKIYDVVGDDIYEMTLKKIWNRLDRHYAALGDPDTELMVYHGLKQNDGEDFSDFVDRLKEQAVRAEMSRSKEADELRAALVERSLVAVKLAYEAKTKKISNNELIRRGVDLCKRLEQKKLRIQLVDQQQPIQQQTSQIHSVSKFGQYGKRSWNDDRRKPAASTNSRACRSCGKTHVGKCNARPKEKLCWKCNKPGHFAVSCGTGTGGTQRQQIHQVNQHDTDNGGDWIE